jgi:AraC-like DNA-binding protein
MLDYEEWRVRLRACCGHYYSEPTRHRDASERFDVCEVQGLDMASARCTIDRMDRTRKGIRRDDAEHFFLWYQVDGETGISHCSQDAWMKPGDFILIDSTREAEVVFNGKTSEFYSVHIPRSLFLADRRQPPATGHKVTARHPLHASLKNLVAESDDEFDLDNFRSEHFFDFVAMVFGPDPDKTCIRQFRHPESQIRFVSQVIDQNLRQHDFSLDQLAVKIGRSKRQLQRDLAQAGTSFTELLQKRRLKHFVSTGKRYGRLGERINIAELAQMSGFSDQSHFNRLFREEYNMTPSSLIKTEVSDVKPG